MGAAPTSWQRAVGFLLIFLVALIWSLSSFISQRLVSDKHKDGHAQVPPFVLTYLATSLFIVYLPWVYIRLWIRQRRLRSSPQRALLTANNNTVDDEPEENEAALLGKYERDEKASVKAAAWATPLWFLAQYSFNVSLIYTTVTSNTILSSGSSLFTYLLSIIFLGETYTHGKLASILACIAGTALVALSDQESGAKGTIWGDSLVLFSEIVYAGYTIVMKKYLPDEETANIPLFFGYIGLFVSISLSPVVIYYIVSGGFNMATIPKEVYVLILLEGLLDYVVADYFWARAVLIIGPTMATVALSVQIPMAALGDILEDDAAWMKHATTVVMTLSGTALIIAGFVGINFGDSNEGIASRDGSFSGSHSHSNLHPSGMSSWGARLYRQVLSLLGLDAKGYAVLGNGMVRKASKDNGVETLPDAVLLQKDVLLQGSGAAARFRRLLNRWFRNSTPREHSVDELIDDGGLG